MNQLTVKDRGRVVKEAVVAKEEQVGAVGPRHRVEDQLPSTFWHLPHIFGTETTPLGKRLQQTTCRFLAFHARWQGFFVFNV